MVVPPEDNRVPLFGPGVRALVVEDEPALLRVLQYRLEWMGMEVTTAANGDDAKLLVEESAPFDVVVSDIRMPGKLNGYALAKHLNEAHPEIPVILCTGFADELTRPQVGLAFRVLQKPFTASELTEALTQALGREPK